MNNLKTTIKLESVYLDEHTDLLNVMNKYNNNVKLEFDMNITDIISLFAYYIDKNIEGVNTEDCECMSPEITEALDETTYDFCCYYSDDEEDDSDVAYLSKEIRNHFGTDFENPKHISVLLRTLLMDCCHYKIIDDIITISMYYTTYKVSWLKTYLEIEHSSN